MTDNRGRSPGRIHSMTFVPLRCLRPVAILAMACLLSACLATPVVRHDPSDAAQAQTERMVAEVAAVAETGDWLVIRGYHGTDLLVSNVTGMPLSHVAIFERETRRTVEADGTGVHESDLGSLVGRAHRVLVVRPRWRTPDNAMAVWQQAQSHVGQRYDFLGTVGLGNAERFYCSELAVGVYRDWFTGHEHFPKVIRPGELYLYGAVLYDSLDRDERADAAPAARGTR
jgi:hypothetical protein